MTRILIADDHALFRDGLRGLLKKLRGIQLVGEARNGRELVELAAQYAPDVILTDIQMPVLDGISATRRIKAQQPSIQVLAMSTFNEGSLIGQMLEAGASGYLLKHAEGEEIQKAIAAVAEGAEYFSDELGPALQQLRRSHFPLPGKELSARETEVLRLICQEHS
ncbi:MAG: response regulator transcription factor, partial [Proteobacteria bacterium]